MHDLTVVGRSTDGTRLILQSADGDRFSLPIDDPLVATAQGSSDDDSPASLEMEMDSPLRPRDIQSRIRAGESPEDLAAAAGTDVERVMVFARPVLAERAHIAERAQRASLRRRNGESGSRLLGDVVSERLRAENVNPETVQWDAWRREDGRWTLTADPPSGDRAEFIFDAAGRYVLAENDAAHQLTDDRPAPEPVPERPSHPLLEPPRAREAKPAAHLIPDEPELPLGEDALDLVSETGQADDWMATQSSERSALPAAESAEPAAEGEETPDEAEEEPEQHQRKARRHRASVPSWDEIMFGSGPQE